MSTEGDLRQGKKDIDSAIASSADWYDMHTLDVSGEAGNVTVATEWTNEVVKGIHNATGGAATIVVRTEKSPSTSVSLILPENGFSGKLPAIVTLVKAGTTAGDYVFFTQHTDTIE